MGGDGRPFANRRHFFEVFYKLKASIEPSTNPSPDRISDTDNEKPPPIQPHSSNDHPDHRQKTHQKDLDTQVPEKLHQSIRREPKFSLQRDDQTIIESGRCLVRNQHVGPLDPDVRQSAEHLRPFVPCKPKIATIWVQHQGNLLQSACQRLHSKDSQ